MATPRVNRQRSTLLATAVVAGVLLFVAQQAIAAGKEVGARAQPAADLQSLLPFIAPLSDSSLLAHGPTNAMVVTRDPFAPTGVARAANVARTPGKSRRPTTIDGQRWVVSTILFEGSRKSAIVNNAWVNIGDSLGGGARLSAVETDHVVVTDDKGVRHKVPIQGGESW